MSQRGLFGRMPRRLPGRPPKWESEAERKRAARMREKIRRGLVNPDGSPIEPDRPEPGPETKPEPERPPLADAPLAVRVEKLREWSRENLVVPPGHPAAGQPLELPGYIWDFVSDVMVDGVGEGLLCMARKNAKTAGIAVLVLAHVCRGGPLAVEGWRAACASVNRDKAGELLGSVEKIARASGMLHPDNVVVRRTPYPGRLRGPYGGLVEVLSADKSAGHAGSYNLVLIDELGLLQERDRALVAGLRSSVSATGGRTVSLTIWGDGPFVPEIVKRDKAREEGLVVHLYQAAKRARIEDRRAWLAANPGLGTVKQVEYMEREARRVLMTVSDQPFFRAFELNQPQSTGRHEAVVPFDVWQSCERDPESLPAREGPAFCGFDMGGTVSLTTFAAFWPRSGRVEYWIGVAGVPDLAGRGLSDGVGDLYELAEAAGELAVFGGGRVVDRPAFIAACLDALNGVELRAIGGDRFRRGEIAGVLEAAELPAACEVVWRGTGAGAVAHGSHDVRAFQFAVESDRLRAPRGVMALQALKECSLRRDGSGNPALDRRTQTSRIDLLSAMVIACGLAALAGEIEVPRPDGAAEPEPEAEPDGGEVEAAAAVLDGPDYGVRGLGYAV